MATLEQNAHHLVNELTASILRMKENFGAPVLY
jgi:hypothetical protein